MQKEKNGMKGRNFLIQFCIRSNRIYCRSLVPIETPAESKIA